jgi:hypothetical protein
MIRLHRLRLSGPRRSYEVDFDRRSSNLAIVAGPIHTGKTTILQMIDFLLGDDEHPTHPELAKTVRSAELELSLNEARWVIERPLFSSEQVAYVRQGRLDETGPTQSKTIDPPGSENALSNWLLEAVGLAGSQLKVTEGNPNSTVHDLSIRDVMWVSFLPSKRLDNEALLHEDQDQKRYKLRQVIELIFNVHDDRLAQLLRQQKRVREERRAAEEEVRVLETFMREEEIAESDALREQLAEAESSKSETAEEISRLTTRAASSTDYAEQLRSRSASSIHST